MCGDPARFVRRITAAYKASKTDTEAGAQLRALWSIVEACERVQAAESAAAALRGDVIGACAYLSHPDRIGIAQGILDTLPEDQRPIFIPAGQ
jgi:hypothetical protein